MSAILEPRGQNHDRIPGLPPQPMDDAGDDDFEINAMQKMVSAMTGSIMTSLLGTYAPVLGPESSTANLAQ